MWEVFSQCGQIFGTVREHDYSFEFNLDNVWHFVHSP